MTRQMPKPVTIARSTARGGRCMTSISCGSNETTSPSATEVTMLTHSTCGAVMGMVKPTKIATRGGIHVLDLGAGDCRLPVADPEHPGDGRSGDLVIAGNHRDANAATVT